ncbi:acyl-CoA thioesterase [Calditrichota bacterium GD2]
MKEFTTTIKVRSYECDIYGHVNNAVYLQYCEAARVEFLETMGYDLQKLKELNILLPIVRIEIDYKRPLFMNELIEVTVKWIGRRKSSAYFEQQIRKLPNGELAAKAKVTWVCTDLKGKPQPIPHLLLDAVKNHFGPVPEQFD